MHQAEQMVSNVRMRVDSRESTSVVQVEGDIDCKTSSKVKTTISTLLRDCFVKRVIVDLKCAVHIDDVGASTLVAIEAANREGKDFILTGLN